MKPYWPSPAVLSLALSTLLPLISCNTNYGKQALSISYDENPGLPTFGTLNGTVTELDTIAPNIALNKTDATLNCSSGFMHINLQFKQPFYGIVYADFDRNSACKIIGNGKSSSVIKLPLKGCGTVQKPARVFTNNIVVRFHPGLEIDGDEVITIVCRYPPPLVPPPVIPESFKLPTVETAGAITPLREFEILLIICAIIFLALLLLGIGCSYYCLKKRNIKVVRRRPISTLGSDVTKISEPEPMFDGLKIPRAHAVDASGSDDVTESVRTDFASEVASLESEEEFTSAYSDKMCILAEGHVISKLHEPPIPNFDINMVVKQGDKAFTPVPSVISSSESETVLNAQEQYLTTILERTETDTLETLERMRKAKAQAGPPPVHARLNIKNKQVSDASDIDTTSEYSRDGTEYSEQELELETRQMKNYSLAEGEFSRMEERDQMSSRGGQINRGYYDDSSEMYGEQRELYHTTATRDMIRPVIRERGGIRPTDMTTTATASNFDVLIRIVNNDSVTTDRYRREPSTIPDDASSIFTEEERHAIRRVLEEDTRIQTQLKRTFTREGFYVLQRNELIREAVEPKKWDVLVRILNDNEPGAGGTTTADDLSSRSSMSRELDVIRPQVSGGTVGRASGAGGLSVLEVESHMSGGGVSAADRSATEITEYHHFSSSQQAFHWEE